MSDEHQYPSASVPPVDDGLPSIPEVDELPKFEEGTSSVFDAPEMNTEAESIYYEKNEDADEVYEKNDEAAELEEAEAPEVVIPEMPIHNVNVGEQRPSILPMDNKLTLNNPILGYNQPSHVMFHIWQNLPEGHPAMPSEDNDLISNWLAHSSPESIFGDAMADPKREWTNHLTHNGQSLMAAAPRYATSGALTGRAAVEAVRRRSHKGRTITVPLYRSCIWLTLRPADESEIVALDQRLSAETNTLGMMTTGLMLNTRASVFVDILLDFCLNLVIGTNVKNLADGMVTSLRDRINVMDYGTLFGHILTSMYPDGYPWRFKCANPNCTHVRDDVRLNFARCIQVDGASINDKQRDMLVKCRNEISDEQLADYSQEFKLTDKDTITLDNGTMIHFKTCSVGAYVDNSRQWITEIDHAYTAAMTTYQTEQVRNNFLNQQIQARRLRKYYHLVDKITIPEDDIEITDAKSIAACLDAMSGDDVLFYQYEDAARQFIEANTISIVGHMTFECDSCNWLPEGKDGRFKSISPLSADRIFFTLVRLKTMNMLELSTE